MNKPSSLVPCTHGLLAHCVEEGPNSNSRSADDPARGQESQGYVPWQDEAEPQSSDTESRSSAPALRGGPSGAAEAKAVALPTQSLGFVVEKDELEGFPGRDVVRRRATAVFYNACVAVLGRSGSTPVTAPDRHRDSSQGRGRDARNPPNENVSRTPPPQHRAQRLYKIANFQAAHLGREAAHLGRGSFAEGAADAAAVRRVRAYAPSPALCCAGWATQRNERPPLWRPAGGLEVCSSPDPSSDRSAP